jgi:hypothetical protein
VRIAPSRRGSVNNNSKQMPPLASPPRAAFAFPTTGGGRNVVVKPADGGNGPGWSMDLFSDTLSSDDDDDDDEVLVEVVSVKQLPVIPENSSTAITQPTISLSRTATRRPPMIKVPAANFSGTTVQRPQSIVASYNVPPVDNAFSKPLLSPITPLLSPRMHMDIGQTAVFGNAGYSRGGGGGVRRDSSQAGQSSYLQTGTGVGPRKLTLPSNALAAQQRRSIDGVW